MKVKVAVRYFWAGSAFYSGRLEHCVAVPLGPVPEAMVADIKEEIVPHWRFSPVPMAVPQTIASLPSRVVANGFSDPQWHICELELKEDRGYWFHDEVENLTPDQKSKVIEQVKEALHTV